MLAIYNNLFEGPVGADITSHIFLEGGTGSGSTPCADATSGIAIFNNVALADQGIATGMFGLFSGNFTSAHGGGVFNNTIISSDSTSDGSNVCFSSNSDVSGMTFENNALSGCNQLIAITSSIGFSPNYNQYGNGGSNAFVCFTSLLCRDAGLVMAKLHWRRRQFGIQRLAECERQRSSTIGLASHRYRHKSHLFMYGVYGTSVL